MQRDTGFRAAVTALLIVVLGAGGCNPDAYSYYVLQHYGSVHGEIFEFGGEDFVALDKPRENRVLLAHVDNAFLIDEWAQIATAFLHRGGRVCNIADTNQITLRQIGSNYLCG